MTGTAMAPKRIITRHVYPPIPFRGCDWIAFYDGCEDGFRGYGETEQAAIDALVEVATS